MNVTGVGYSKEKGSAAGAAAARQAMKGLGSAEPRAVFVFAAPSHDYPQLLSGIKKEVRSALILGCSTAGEFTGEAQGHDSIAVMAIGGDNLRVNAGVGNGLRKDMKGSIKAAMSGFHAAYRTARAEGFSHATCYVLTDGLVGNGEELVELVHQETNQLAQVVGGAAADAAKFEKTQVIYGDDAASDRVAVASLFTRTPIGLGVQHGLASATKPKVVTKSQGGVVFEIDGKPAFEAYREYAKSKGVTLDEKNRENFMIVNELGMVTPDGHKIRAPLKANPDGSLLMAAEIPRGSAICIMGGTEQALISGSEKAAAAAAQALKGTPPAGTLVFDCICRRVFLGDAYHKQIAAIARAAGGAPLAGWETYGEIAMTPTQPSGWHNSTSVVSVLPQ